MEPNLDLFNYLEHNMELWLIKIGDVPDLATSLYHMFRFQIWDTFFNFDDNVKWNKIFWPILNLWKISFRYYIYSLNSTNMLSPAWNYGWLKIKRFLFSDMRYIQSFIQYFEHNMELWLIKNGDVPDSATHIKKNTQTKNKTKTAKYRAFQISC